MTRDEMIEALRHHIDVVWPQMVVDAGVTMKDGRAYNPARGSRSATPLVFARAGDGAGMLEEMHKILDLPNFRHASGGWEKVCEVSYTLTWEFQATDPLAPWADLFNDTQRANVLEASRDSLIRRGA